MGLELVSFFGYIAECPYFAVSGWYTRGEKPNGGVLIQVYTWDRNDRFWCSGGGGGGSGVGTATIASPSSLI